MRKVITTSISIEPELLEFIDEVAKLNYVSRSAVISNWARHWKIMNYERHQDGKETR